MQLSTPTVGIMAALDAALVAIRANTKDVPTALAVVIASGGGKKHGHFEASAWEDTNGEGAPLGHRHEILMSSESLARGGYGTFVTLLHEAAHAANHATGTKDTSRQGRFHNAKFRDTAEKFGLVVTTDPSIGHITTGLQSWAETLYAPQIEALSAALTTHRVLTPKAATKKTTVKVACECIGDNGNPLAVTVPIKWYESQNLTCGDCGEGLSPVE